MSTPVFKAGMRVRMRSSYTNPPGGWIHGVVEPWPEGGTRQPFIVIWKETGMGTALPNPNVEEDLED